MKPFEWIDAGGKTVRVARHHDQGGVLLFVRDAYGYATVVADPATGRQIAHAILTVCDELDPPTMQTIHLRFDGLPDVALTTPLPMGTDLVTLLKAYGEASFNAGAALARRAIKEILLRPSAEPEPADPVRIDRWLTVEDVEKHGNRWRWYGPGWIGGVIDAIADVNDDGVTMIRNGMECAGCFKPGDYFTPIKE